MRICYSVTFHGQLDHSLTIPHESGFFVGSVLDVFSKYRSPLIISLASEETLKADIEAIRPNWNRSDEENWAEALVAPPRKVRKFME